MLYPFRAIYKIYFLFVFVLSVIIVYPFIYYLLSNPKRFPKAFILMRWHSYALLLLAGARLRVEGIENIPKEGAYIICPNHTSYLDIFCVYAIIDKYFVFTGKKEIEKWPLFHIYYTSGMNILVDRQSQTGSITALKRMVQEIDKGNAVAIFPEGTISKQAPLLEPFKPGAFAIAIQKQIPILPITFVSNWRRLQRGGFWSGKAGPGIAHIIVNKPIITAGLSKKDIEQLQTQVQTIMNNTLLNALK